MYNYDQTQSRDETHAISRRSNSKYRSVLLADVHTDPLHGFRPGTVIQGHILQSLGQTGLVRTVTDPTTSRGGGF